MVHTPPGAMPRSASIGRHQAAAANVTHIAPHSTAAFTAATNSVYGRDTRPGI